MTNRSKGKKVLKLVIEVEADHDGWELEYGEEFTVAELKADVRALVIGCLYRLENTHPLRIVTEPS